MACHWSGLELAAGCSTHPGPAAGAAEADRPGVRRRPPKPEHPSHGRNIPMSGIIDSGTMARAERRALVGLGAASAAGRGAVEAALADGHAAGAVRLGTPPQRTLSRRQPRS